MTLPRIAVVAALSLCVSAVFAQPVDYEGNLSKVPPTDPAPQGTPPEIVPALRNKHPRLLFTSDEIAASAKLWETDPVLSVTRKNLLAWAERQKVVPETPKPAVVLNDTAALTTSVNRNVGVAYAYAISKNPKIKTFIVDLLTQMLEQPYWADTAELDSNMGAGNNMLMVGLLYDVVYDELDPALRKKLAEKMLLHVRRMHYLGYLERSLMPIKYWQQDPQNNHRWHRNAGMAACLLSIADEPGIDVGYLLEQRKAEIDFIHKWYPADGDCHEGAGYQQFGFLYQAINAVMMDRVLGTSYLESPGLRNAWTQQIYFGAPGRTGNQSFGDDMNGDGYFNHLDAAFFIGPKLSRDADAQAALAKRMVQKQTRKDNRPPEYPWSLLAFYDPTLTGGDAAKLPLHRLFADLGAVSVRSSWEQDATLLTFKAGPYAGYKLNEYAHANPKDGRPHYVNIAHDDPDANAFALGIAGDFLFHPGLYATTKRTITNNTLTVDGVGQIGEGEAYTQPIKDVDMRTLSALTTYKADATGRVVFEGEAAKMYVGLERFRRTMLWMPGDYALVVDNLKTDGPARTLTWRGTVEKGQFDDAAAGLCHAYTRSGARVDFQMLADAAFTGAIDYIYLDGRFGGQLMQQFQFAANVPTVRYACLLDPWKKQPRMTLENKNGVAMVTVKIGNHTDTWTLPDPTDTDAPTMIVAERDGKEIIRITAADKAPRGDVHE